MPFLAFLINLHLQKSNPVMVRGYSASEKSWICRVKPIWQFSYYLYSKNENENLAQNYM